MPRACARGTFVEEKSVKSARRLPPGVSGPAACSRLGGRPRHIAGLAGRATGLRTSGSPSGRPLAPPRAWPRVRASGSQPSCRSYAAPTSQYRALSCWGPPASDRPFRLSAYGTALGRARSVAHGCMRVSRMGALRPASRPAGRPACGAASPSSIACAGAEDHAGPGGRRRADTRACDSRQARSKLSPSSHVAGSKLSRSSHQPDGTPTMLAAS